MKFIGLRREDKNIWEKRVPLVPEHVQQLKKNYSIQTVLQPFPNRAFSDKEFQDSGAIIDEELTNCDIILAVKEIPIKLLRKNKTYAFFSHTIKGQKYNMPLLQQILDLECTLIDYECIVDENGRRQVFFGNYAGLAGMIDTFYGLGQRLLSRGIESPFLDVKPAFKYQNVLEAKKELSEIAEKIKDFSFPNEFGSLVVGFLGYGNVSRGAQEIFDIFPHHEISPQQLLKVGLADPSKIYKVVFKEEDMVEPLDSAKKFDLQEYYNKPERYKSKFDKYLKHLSIVVNAIFWNESYPRFITKKYLKENIVNRRLDLVTDITCDINGAIEFTVKSTKSDNPAFVYNPLDDSIVDGYKGEGIVNIAVDNLPAELPVDSSIAFSESLFPFIPSIVNADFTKSLENSKLDPAIIKGVIVYKGKLTPQYKYLEKYL